LPATEPSARALGAIALDAGVGGLDAQVVEIAARSRAEMVCRPLPEPRARGLGYGDDPRVLPVPVGAP
jgi:hypothetical protein